MRCFKGSFIPDNVERRISVTDTTNLADILNVNLESWKGQAERLHIVYKVFPFSAGKTDEVMLYGKSEYDYDNGTTGEMPWSARLQFKRSDSGIAIDFYQVYSVSLLAFYIPLFPGLTEDQGQLQNSKGSS